MSQPSDRKTSAYRLMALGGLIGHHGLDQAAEVLRGWAEEDAWRDIYAKSIRPRVIAGSAAFVSDGFILGAYDDLDVWAATA